jgi:RecB family exonuclease
MNTMLKELQTICHTFLLKEKIMIVDSPSIGENIMEAYLKNNNQSINLSYKTVRELALKIVKLNTNIPFTYLEPTIGVHFTYQLLLKNKKENLFQYFGGLEVTPALSNAVYQTIRQLRLAGFTADSIKPESFLSPEKGEDMRLILSGYEELLRKMNFMDEAALYQKALEILVAKESDTIFILQSNLSLSYLEEKFLTGIINGNVYKLPLERVNGISLPERSNLRSIAWGGSTAYSYLYQLEDAKEPADMTVSIAKTEEIEVKNVIEQLKYENIQLDEAVVFYTNQDPYITNFYHLSEKIGIPITFGEGLPITFSRPGRLVTGLMEWLQSNYSVTSFITLLNENVIALEEGAPSKTEIIKILRDTGIGWSKERYSSLLKAEINRVKDKKEKTDNGNAIKVYEKRIQDMAWLELWFRRIFKHLPNIEAMIHYQTLLGGIEYVIAKLSNPVSSHDQLGKTALLDQIGKILPYSDEELKWYDAFEKVKDLLLQIRINKSRPQPGFLHVTSYKNGIYESRPHVFILGLDNKRFPGDSSENPLLLDAEKVKLGNGLPLLSEKGKENTYTMLQLLAQSQGRVSISFSNFDINENRVVSPAHLFLQCYRLMTHKLDADFKELQKLPVKISTSVIEAKDYWNQMLSKEESKQISEELLHYFSNIEWGTQAEAARNEGVFTPFDGMVTINEQIFDPRKNQEKTMTAGRLEALAKCPYSYFLQEILGVRPIEDVSYDPYRWLDPATRGSLLHQIFEIFYRKLAEEGTKPSLNTHKEMILQLAEDIIQQQKELIPPPSERVFSLESQDIYQCCLIFLKEEEEYGQSYHPQYFEYSFGIGGNPPAVIKFPSGETMNLSGKIDRVDRTNSGKFHIIDYKTGSTYGYGKNKPFKGGRQLQHFVYALAIEEHLKLGAGAVEESSYFFPSNKGLGQRFSRKQDDVLRANGMDLLEKLIDIIRSGHFPMTDDENDCTYCKLKDACRRGFYDPDILDAKRMDQNIEGLTKFRGYRSYE